MNLKTLIIPSTVTTIGYDIVHLCPKLTNLVIEDGNTVFDSRDNCNAVIETASNKLIIGCVGSVIPTSVTSINKYAFESSHGLTSITIPSSVKTIGFAAFHNCPDLKEVKVDIKIPLPIVSEVFSNYENMKLLVPRGCKVAYESTSPWNRFKEIVEFDATGIDQLVNDEAGDAMIFTLDGKRIDKPQKGLNIVKTSDGKISKKIVK